MSHFQFQQQVDKALKRVRTILDNTKNPVYATDVQHEYSDKFLLVEFLSTTAIAALQNSFEALGVTPEILTKLKTWAKTHNVTLKFSSDEKCTFLRKTEREIESNTKHVVEKETSSGKRGRTESYTVTKVHEWFWNFTAEWTLSAHSGKHSVNIKTNKITTEHKTTTDTTPYPKTNTIPTTEINITWFLQHIENESFKINRKNNNSCKTPSNNTEVLEALQFFSGLNYGFRLIHNYFFKLSSFHESLGQINTLDDRIKYDPIFIPILPIFEKKAEIEPLMIGDVQATENNKDEGVLPEIYSTSLLEEHRKSTKKKIKEVSKTVENHKFLTTEELKITLLLVHVCSLSQVYKESIDYVENMLRKQLTAAIGKEITSKDFSDYLSFHNRKFFKKEFGPNQFTYAVRRPNHDPEGSISIEESNSGTPITTFASNSTTNNNRNAHPMFFNINASTTIQFNGERHLHGWINHEFAGVNNENYSLVARARQFSSFIILVGRISSANTFEPKNAVIVKDKDEILIPLLLETIPTAKQFKDAISSLSPEQQEFAKAFRGMQLESTLFGVVIIQIKPQLEKLLRLDDDSLTKKIKLTQDLLDLFIKYQIPSDMLSFDGKESESTEHKIDTVKKYTKKMVEMIKESGQEQLDHAVKEQEYRFAQDDENRIYASAKKKRKGESDRYISDCKVGLIAARRLRTHESAPAQVQQLQSQSAQLQQVQLQQSQSQSTQQTEEKAAKKQRTDDVDMRDTDEQVEDTEDYTKLPAVLEKRFEDSEVGTALHSTIIHTGETWWKKYYPSLLAKQISTSMQTGDQKTEKNKAFDLLDALTKSGALSIDHASLHVIIASTHVFDKSIVDTVVKDNINPIEKVENSSIIVASLIHQIPQDQLLIDENQNQNQNQKINAGNNNNNKKKLLTNKK